MNNLVLLERLIEVRLDCGEAPTNIIYDIRIDGIYNYGGILLMICEQMRGEMRR